MTDLNLAPYQPLDWDEIFFIILPYWEENNREPMDHLLHPHAKMTDGMRRFIEDVNNGTIKRPDRKKGRKLSRDFKIHDQIEYLLNDESGDGLLSDEERMKVGKFILLNRDEGIVNGDGKAIGSNKRETRRAIDRLWKKIPLRMNQQEYYGAATIVAERFEISESAAIKVYQRIKKRFF